MIKGIDRGNIQMVKGKSNQGLFVEKFRSDPN